MSLPGQACGLGTLLWKRGYVAGNKRTFTFNLSRVPAPLTRQSAQRAIRMLELAGLISVERRPGRCLIVTINPCPSIEEQVTGVKR